MTSRVLDLSSVRAACQAAIQRSKASILSAGQAPSQGIVPALSRVRMASACWLTSWTDQRSKAKRMASRGPCFGTAV